MHQNCTRKMGLQAFITLGELLTNSLNTIYLTTSVITLYSKTCLKQPLKKIVFQDLLSLNAGQKYCRMLQRGAFGIKFDLPKATISL